MENVLHPMDHHRTGRIVRQLHDALHPEQDASEAGPQQIDEDLQSLRRQGLRSRQRDTADLRPAMRRDRRSMVMGMAVIMRMLFCGRSILLQP